MKKQTGTIKRRLIAIALTAVALTSFATMTITSASAATAQTTGQCKPAQKYEQRTECGAGK